MLVFWQWFDRITGAIESERKLKKWSRAKKGGLHTGRLRSTSATLGTQITASFKTPAA
jgi:putative endonuclease